MKLVYVVICPTLTNNVDKPYYIDSIWTSKKKAEKRCEVLNSSDKLEWRYEYGYNLFSIESNFISV